MSSILEEKNILSGESGKILNGILKESLASPINRQGKIQKEMEILKGMELPIASEALEKLFSETDKLIREVISSKESLKKTLRYAQLCLEMKKDDSVQKHLEAADAELLILQLALSKLNT